MEQIEEVTDMNKMTSELLSLSIKAGRRASYDLLHACDDIPDKKCSDQYRQRAEMWLEIFNFDNGMKDYRHSLHKEIWNLEFKVDRLTKLLKENGIVDEDGVPF